MNLASTHSSNKSFNQVLAKIKPRPGLAFGVIILSALVAFEIFNYSTTDYALRDLLGDLRFAGIHWATILALAFCGIDFAGIARLFTPEQGDQEPKEIWYMFGAWLLAATMNAILTWWGVSMAISNHSIESRVMIDSNTINTIVPVFVALMIWIIRILLIGSLSSAGERIFSDGKRRTNYNQQPSRGIRSNLPAASPTMSSANMASRAVPRPGYSNDRSAPRPEPTYHSMNTRPAGRHNSANRNEANSSAYHL
ncbi:MAG: hypothetical protein ACYDGL_03220 [Bellilinea sp.]